MNLVLVSLLATLAGPQDPQWIGDYGDALANARAARKPLLVVLDDTSQSALRTASLRKVAPLLSPYVLCRIDVTTPYGRNVASAFQAKSFPYTAVIDNTGSKVLERRQGAMSDSQWSALLTAHQTGRRAMVAPPVFMMPQQCFS